jgi:hypothetical protein
MVKFDKFVNSNEDILIHYNKNFSLPKCVKSKKKKKCSCFAYKKNIDFSFEFPLSAIQLLKNHVKKTLIETEKHNNYNTISLNQSANYTRRLAVRHSVRDHKNTLVLFKKYFEKKIKDKKPKEFLKYMIYIDNQMTKCCDFLNDTVPWQYDELVPLIILTSSLYAHYHTLKLFECFVK